MLGKRLLNLIIAFAVVIIIAGGGTQVLASDSEVMLAKVTTDKSSAKLSWKKVSGADRYVVYFNNCDGKALKNKVKTLSADKTSYSRKGLKASRDYKFMVAAQKKIKGKYQVIAKSRNIHVVTTTSKKTNVKSVTIKPASLQLYIGDTVDLKASSKKSASKKPLLGAGHGAAIVWHSSNPAVVKVNKNGKITALAKGSCKIYASSISGVWGTASVKVRKPKTEKVDVPKKEREYTVTYEYTGDVPEGAPDVPEAKTYSAGASVKKQTAAPALKGYTFSGWDGEVTTMPEKDVTVSGYWKPNKHTVTFKYTDPRKEKEVSSSVKYTYGEKVSAIDEPEIRGYKFKGWEGVPETMPDEDVTVTGAFSKLCKVKAVVFVRRPSTISMGEDQTSPYNLYETYETEVEAGTLSVEDLYEYFPKTQKYINDNKYSVFAGWYTGWNEVIRPMEEVDEDLINQKVNEILSAIFNFTTPGSLDPYIEQFGIDEPPCYLPEDFNEWTYEDQNAFADEHRDEFDEWARKQEEIVREHFLDLTTGLINDDIYLYSWVYILEPVY